MLIADSEDHGGRDNDGGGNVYDERKKRKEKKICIRIKIDKQTHRQTD